MAYTQLYRTGIIEASSIILSYEKAEFSLNNFIGNFLRFLEKGIGLLETLKVPCPIIVSVSLLGFHDYTLKESSEHENNFGHTARILGRNEVFLPEQIINEFDDNMTDFSEPIFRLIANAFGRDYEAL